MLSQVRQGHQRSDRKAGRAGKRHPPRFVTISGAWRDTILPTGILPRVLLQPKPYKQTSDIINNLEPHRVFQLNSLDTFSQNTTLIPYITNYFAIYLIYTTNNIQ